MSSQIRKLYIDSRIGCTGNPSDFTFQLPSAVPTSVDEGIVISQLNMPNLFTTVMANFTDRLYFSLDLAGRLWAHRAQSATIGIYMLLACMDWTQHLTDHPRMSTRSLRYPRRLFSQLEGHAPNSLPNALAELDRRG
jgi:hypothetical protein